MVYLWLMISPVASQSHQEICLVFCNQSGMLLDFQACGSGAEQNQNWQPLEAALFCIQAIAKSVSIEEKEILPQV